MIFILNKQEKVVNILRNGGGANEAPPFFDDIYSQDLATGAETFTFSTVAINNVARDLVVGNYVAFKNDEGEYKLFQITQTEEYHEDAMYMNVYAEGAGLELINKVFRARKSPSTSLRKFMEMVLDETGWNVGAIPLSAQESLDLDLEDATVYATLQNTLSKYGVEMAFRCEINNGRISSKFVDLYTQRGRVTGKRFTFGRDIEGIRRKVDSTELFTALIGKGNKDISFKDVTVDGINKPLGQDFVADQEAYDRYNNNGYHIIGIFNYDTESPEELLRETYKQLQKCKEPKIEYEVSVALLGELLGESWNKVSIGDTVAIVDNAFNPPIHLMARVSKLDKSFTNNQSDTCTLSNFVEVQSNINDSMRKIASQLEGYVESKFPIKSEDITEGAINGSHMDATYISQVTADIVTASIVEANKIITEELEAVEGKFESIVADKIEVTEGKFNNIIAENIQAIDAKFESVNAELGEFNTVITDKIEAVEGEFSRLEADVIEADRVIAESVEGFKGEFEVLEAQVGKIDSLVSGNISSGNIQTGGITGDNLNMETIFVKDANILDLSASKLTAGEIDTSKIVITSKDGGMRLVGSTQQFIDENDRIRIQLGKDANGDFDFYILAENGDILFNTRGITGNAIENGLIKENMVSDGAIGGKKINWSSFVTEFNKDSNTHKLNSSKVLLDGTNQTLDIHFNRLNSTVNDNVNKTESNTTQLNVHQGKINTLIQDTTITKDGKNVKLKDEYSKLEQTVGGLKSTVGEQQTTINQNTGKITSAENKVSTLEQTVNGFNSELSHVKTTIDEQEEAINSVNSALSGKANSNDVYKKSETMTTSAINSAINQSADSIKLGISETYETKTNVENKISTAVNNVQIGGKNLLTGTKDFTGWGVHETATLDETYNGVTVCKNSYIGGSGGYKDLAKYNTITPEPKTEYTLSFWAKGTGYIKSFFFPDTVKNGVGSQGQKTTATDGRISTKLSSDWERYWITWTTTDSVEGIKSIIPCRMEGSADITAYICGVKLEIGNKATDYSEAPEDIQASIDSKASKTDVYTKTEVYTKAQTDSAIKVAKDEINLGVSKVEEISKITSMAKMLYTDVDFREGFNNIGVYNNSNNGTVVLSRVAKNADCPTKSTHMIQITTSGSASPGHGGFTFSTQTRANAVFITKFLAKIPSGSYLTWHSNPVGDGAKCEWLTSMYGTGNWTEYICKLTCGASGSFSSTNYFALNGGSTPVTWYLGMATVYDLTDTSQIEKRMETAEQKITSSAIISTVQGAINTAKNEAINSANSSTDTKLNNYATKSSLTQTANNITAKFESSGGYNLLKNSGFKNDITHWTIQQHGSPTGSYGFLNSTATWGYPDSSVNTCQIRYSNQSGKEYGLSQKFNTAIGKTYTISFYYAAHRLNYANIIIRNSNSGWLSNKYFNPQSYSGGNSNISNWGKISLTFTATETSHILNIVAINGQDDGYFWIAKPQITEGEAALPYSPHPDEIYSGSTVIDASGVTINNGALRVKNKSGTTVLSGDSNGNLVFTGTAKSQSGSQWVGLDSGGVTFQDSQRNEQMLRIGLAFYDSNRDMNGVEFAMPKYSDFMRFSHISKENLNSGWTSSDTTYNFFELWSGEQPINGSVKKKGMTVRAPMYVNNGIKLYSGNSHTSDLSGAITWNTINGMMGVCGDNGAFIGYKSGDNLQTRIVTTEGTHPGTGDHIRSWGNWNLSEATIHNGHFNGKSLTISGSKNCIQKTEHYGDRLINAYETAEYYFGDIGSGKINKDGECIVYIDDVFLECINTNSEYHVFTQCYNGAIKSIERNKTYFIVTGEPETIFSWELKAKRIGYENNRLDVQDLEVPFDSGIEMFGDEDFKVSTSEEILVNSILFELENLLLTEDY